MVDTCDFRNRIDSILDRIRNAAVKSGRSFEEVSLLAVTKTHPVDLILKAVKTGLIPLLGENRVQEAQVKIESWPLECPVSWHLIGHLQRNKARKAVALFDMIHSVDNVRLARSINSISLELEKSSYPVLVEVNTSGELSKHGVSPEDTNSLVEYICSNCPNLDLRGFMTVGPLCDDQDRVRRAFESLRLIRDEAAVKFGRPFEELSMGMSGDFELAIEEGSTIVRVGSSIFGDRTEAKF